MRVGGEGEYKKLSFVHIIAIPLQCATLVDPSRDFMVPSKILLWALPVVFLLSLAEAITLTLRARFSGTEPFDWRAMSVSLFDQLVRHFILAVPISLAAPVFALAWQHRVATITLGPWWTFAVLFVGQEFCYYWFHRAAHRVRWFWATHAVHHSPNQLNLSAAYRLGWTGRLTGSTVFYTPLVWLGFEPRLVLTMLALNLLYQFWIHATWIPRLGWLEKILNTPSAHRVHHASNLRYLDANYGGVLILFDRLFGTYIPEDKSEPCIYGLVKPVTSYNPLVVELSQWVALGRDLLAARSLREVIGLLCMPPGWRANGEHETTEALRARAGLAVSTLPAPSQAALAEVQRLPG